MLRVDSEHTVTILALRPRQGAFAAILLFAWMACPTLASAQTPSCGCDLAPPVGPGRDTTLQLTGVDGSRDGAYVLYVPQGYSSATPMPLVVALHGWTGTGSGMKRGSGLDKTANRFGFVAAFPDGVDYPAAGRGWAFPGCNASPDIGMVDACGRRAVCEIGDRYDCDSTTCGSATCVGQCSEDLLNCLGEPPADCPDEQCSCTMGDGTNCNWCGCVDDQAFLQAVVDDVASRVCVDLERVYLTGMSAGGMMTSWMSGEPASPFAAFAPQSGTDPRDFYRLAATDADVGVMWLHGTRDTTVPHDGARASDGYRYEGAADQAGYLAPLFGCSTTASTWDVPASVQAPANANLACTEFPDCSEAIAGSGPREVVYCLWDGGHQWAKSPGKSESVYWGNRLIWEFLARHARHADPPTCEPPPSGCLCDGTNDPCSALATKSACQGYNDECGTTVCAWSGNPITGSCGCFTDDGGSCKQSGSPCRLDTDCCGGSCLAQPRGPDRCG